MSKAIFSEADLSHVRFLGQRAFEAARGNAPHVEVTPECVRLVVVNSRMGHVASFSYSPLGAYEYNHVGVTFCPSWEYIERIISVCRRVLAK